MSLLLIAACFMQNKRLENCTPIKTVLMLLVILYHSCVFWTGTWWSTDPILPSKALGYFATWLNSFHIYAFALASGYIFTYIVSNGGYNSFLPFLRNKTKRLLIPYVFVALVWLIPVSIVMFQSGWGQIVDAYVLCMHPDQLWFLWMLFGVFLIIWPMRRLMMDRPAAGYAIAIACYGIGIVGKKMLPNIFCIWTAFQYIPLFFFGMRIKCKENRGKANLTEKIPWFVWVIFDLILFAATIYSGRREGILWSAVDIGLNFLLHVTGAVMAWSVLQTLADKFNWKDSRALRTLSTYAMPMYLFHQQIIYFTVVWLDGKVNPWLHAGINFLAAFAGSLIVSAILMRWRTTRFLIGEK